MEKQQQRQQRSCHTKPATFDQHFVLGSIWIYQSVTCDKDERKYNSKGVKERGFKGEGVCIYKGRIRERGLACVAVRGGGDAHKRDAKMK